MSEIVENGVALQLVQSLRYQVIYQIMVGNKPIGEIELDQIAWRSGEAELRIAIEEGEMQNKGYGTAAVVALLEQAFLKMNLKRVYLRVQADNAKAIRCYEKAGFRKEGRLSRITEQNKREEIFLMGIPKEDFLRADRPDSRAI